MLTGELDDAAFRKDETIRPAVRLRGGTYVHVAGCNYRESGRRYDDFEQVRHIEREWHLDFMAVRGV